MKNGNFFRRIRYAASGIRTAFRKEKSFRTQTLFAAGAVLLLILTRPGALWSAVVLIMAALVLAAELINTALELIVDRLHPEQHPMIGNAKDCAAGAVFILSLTSLGVAFALLWDYFGTMT